MNKKQKQEWLSVRCGADLKKSAKMNALKKGVSLQDWLIELVKKALGR